MKKRVKTSRKVPANGLSQRTIAKVGRGGETAYFVAGNVCLVVSEGRIVTCIPTRWAK